MAAITLPIRTGWPSLSIVMAVLDTAIQFSLCLFMTE